MNYADLVTAPNGFPLEADATLGFMQSDYQSAIRGIAAAFAGNGVIVSGMVEAGTVVSDGWIYIGDDLVRFQGGTKTANFYIEQVKVQKANQSGTLYDRYTTKTAKFGSGRGAVAYSSLIRLESVFGLQSRLIDALTPEPNVVLSGCLVSAVNTGASTLGISAGTAIINRRFVVTSGYTGGYPAYLTETGQWVNTAPANFIRFDPHCSQRLADVQRRAGAATGEIKMMAVLSDRFDNTGLGKWEQTGWAVCNGANGTADLRSRFPVAYDPRITDPGGNLWSSAYNTPAATGGEKAHTLTLSEMPVHNHTGGSGAVAANASGLMRRSQTGENVTVGSPDNFGSGTEPDITASPTHIPNDGGGSAHENRPPFLVVVFIQKI